MEIKLQTSGLRRLMTISNMTDSKGNVDQERIKEVLLTTRFLLKRGPMNLHKLKNRKL